MSFEVECVHLGIADLLSDRVVAGLEDGVHRQATRRRGATDEGQQRVPGAERHAGPVATDLAEKSMLDRVPLRAARWIVAHGHRQAEAIADLDLQPFLPGTDLTAVAATCVGQQQQVVGRRDRRLALRFATTAEMVSTANAGVSPEVPR